MYESIVFCSSCTMSSVRKFTLAISSLEEFLVLFYVYLTKMTLNICHVALHTGIIFSQFQLGQPICS